MISDISLDADEQLLRRVRRSKIGLLPLILGLALVAVATLVGVFAVGRYQDQLPSDVPLPLALSAIIGLGLLLAMMLYLALRVFINNQLILTNERVVIIAQKGIFHQDISEVSLSDVQEISVQQRGLLPGLFNFGTVTIETAGEKDNLRFKLTTAPHRLRESLNDAYEIYKERHQSPVSTPTPPVIP